MFSFHVFSHPLIYIFDNFKLYHNCYINPTFLEVNIKCTIVF
nr:MAG TPA: hypothetical protein [Caudoviricetes sp.]DAR37020.1 MAG TPA: hypothetical protein [Caudoviricetes sp.]DAU88300.1 MAG TPA: hypothetical protein [Caudoviricetes sp.]DAW96121.1 MAG TPA: hypothetical protein [Bacteriophage sp.]